MFLKDFLKWLFSRQNHKHLKLYVESSLVHVFLFNLWYTCSSFSVVHVFFFFCGTRAPLFLWYTCSYFPVVHVFLFFYGTRVPIFLWYTCSSFSVVHMFLFFCGTRVPLFLWYTCSYFSVVHVFLFYLWCTCLSFICGTCVPLSFVVHVFLFYFWYTCSSFICRLQEGLKKAVTPSNKRMFINVDNFNIANICKCYQSFKYMCAGVWTGFQY